MCIYIYDFFAFQSKLFFGKEMKLSFNQFLPWSFDQFIPYLLKRNLHSLTLMKTLRYFSCFILTSSLVSSFRILEVGEDVGARIQPDWRSDVIMEDGSMPSMRSSQNNIFYWGTLRTKKRSSPLDEYGFKRPKSTDHEEILRSTVQNSGKIMRSASFQPPVSVHSYGILRKLRSLPVDE